jgi:nitroreductase
MTTATTGKTATTAAPLHPLLAERWSPRGFDPRHELTDSQLTALLEAARWAPSASNTQPWRFGVTLRGTLEHAAVLDTLAPGNRAWAQAASALIVVAAQTQGPDGEPRPWALYDTGQAVAHLSVQAEHEGLAVHQMGGFDAERIAAVLAAPDTVTPLVVLAVGRRDESVRLPEPFATRESAARHRLPLTVLRLPLDSTQAVPAAA